MTCSPSVMGEPEAHVPLSLCAASCGVISRAVFSHATRPSLRLIASTLKACGTRGLTPPSGLWLASPVVPAGTAVETYTRSPQTIGEAEPRPGISTFHLMFLVSLHSIGGS